MKWITQQPTRPGWYWFRTKKHREAEVLLVRDYAGELAVGNTRIKGCQYYEERCEWSDVPVEEPSVPVEEPSPAIHETRFPLQRSTTDGRTLYNIPGVPYHSP